MWTLSPLAHDAVRVLAREVVKDTEGMNSAGAVEGDLQQTNQFRVARWSFETYFSM